MPDVLEAYDILDNCGIGDGERPSNAKMKKNVIKNMSSIIDISDIKDASSYEDLFQMVDDMLQPLSTIADEIIIKTFQSFKKKSS